MGDPWSLLKSLDCVISVTYLFLTVSFLLVLWSYGRSVEFTQVLESLGVRPGYAARFVSLAMSAGWV